jgi:hypothetical protein
LDSDQITRAADRCLSPISLRGARLTTPAVPATLDELLTPEWLTAALSQRFPGLEVTGITPGPIVSRLSTNARFTIETAGDLPDGLPASLCAKGYFTDKGRPVTFLGAREVMFYRELADFTGVRTLDSVYADVDPQTGHNVVITGDVIVAGGVFLDALSPYTPDQTADSLTQYAKLHGRTWGGKRWADTKWLDWPGDGGGVRGIDDIRENFDGPIGAGVPDEAKDPERLLAALGALMGRGTSGTWSVLHGDAHVGNVFLDDQQRPSLLDWQCVRRGHWAIDIGYHIASALETADREKSERDLLAHYLEELAANGVDAPGWDEAWAEYRRGIVFGFFMWAVTHLVDPEITTTLLQRIGSAVAMHDSFGANGA